MGFRIGLGGSIGPVRLGVSNRGFGGGVGPLSMGYGFSRRGADDGEGAARFFGKVIALMIISIPMMEPAAAIMFLVAWLFQLPDDTRNGWIIGLGLGYVGLVALWLWEQSISEDDDADGPGAAPQVARPASPRTFPVVYDDRGGGDDRARGAAPAVSQQTFPILSEGDDLPASHGTRNAFRVAVGDQVDHEEFGRGTVLRVSYDELQTADVQYIDGTIRLLDVAFDPMVRLRRTSTS